MASLPPPKMMISSLMATARWPCRGLGAGPVVLWIFFHLRFSGFSAGRAVPDASSATVPAAVLVVVAIFDSPFIVIGACANCAPKIIKWALFRNKSHVRHSRDKMSN